MGRCDDCKRTDIKCCTTCARNGATCNVWHKCGEDCKEYKKQTNADRIRNMTDEELAEFINRKIACDCCSAKHCNSDERCEVDILQWLKSEVKE